MRKGLNENFSDATLELEAVDSTGIEAESQESSCALSPGKIPIYDIRNSISDIATATSASSLLNSLEFFNKVVSHTTTDLSQVKSILNGIHLDSHPKNLFGSHAFYTAAEGYSFIEVGEIGYPSIVFKLSQKAHIFDENTMRKHLPKSLQRASGRVLADYLRREGYNVIVATSLNTDHLNYTIINNPKQLLKPIGVYPAPPGGVDKTIASMRMIRGVQALGGVAAIAGVTLAVREVIQSDRPLTETAHQSTLFAGSIAAGMVAGELAILPCAGVGVACPPAAPFTVPACILGASVLGGAIGATGAEYLWRDWEAFIESKDTNKDRLLPYSTDAKSEYLIRAGSKDRVLHFLNPTKLGRLVIDSADIYSRVTQHQNIATISLDGLSEQDRVAAVRILGQIIERIGSWTQQGQRLAKILSGEVAGFFGVNAAQATPLLLERTPQIEELSISNGTPAPELSPQRPSLQRGPSNMPSGTNEVTTNTTTIESISHDQAEEALNSAQSTVFALARAWCADASDIRGFEDCPEIQEIAVQLESAEQTAMPPRQMMEIAHRLKDAKTREVAERQNFDEQMQYVEGLVGLTASAVWVGGNRRLANQITSIGGAAINIGTQVAALAGIGMMAASVCPPLALASIAMSCISIYSSLEGDASNSEVNPFKQLGEMVENLRREMHDRFDIVEQKLEILSRDITFKLEHISLQQEEALLAIGAAARFNETAHDRTHQSIISIQKLIDIIFQKSYSEQIDRELHAITDVIRCSINNINIRPTPEQYAAWLAQFKLFVEQSIYSSALSGNKEYYGNDRTSSWCLNQQGVTYDALFQVNALLGYFEQHVPAFRKYERQPNELLWQYSSLAILRLILLHNNRDTGLIRRNEFDILNGVANQAERIRQFKLDIKNPDIISKLVLDYRSSLVELAATMKQTLSTLLSEHNSQLNENLEMRRKKAWLNESKLLSKQPIHIRTTYPGWFSGTTVCHYGATESNHRNAASHGPEANYLTQQKKIVDALRQPKPTPRYQVQPGITVSIDEAGAHLKVTATGGPHIALPPEVDGDPILHLYGEKGIHINLVQRMNIPPLVTQAEFLGLGETQYRYKYSPTRKKLYLKATFMMNQVPYPIASISCSCDIGIFDRNEGIVWGWLGTTAVSFSTATTTTIGSTGNSKHWFRASANIPTLTNDADAGPFLSLVNPAHPRARRFRSSEHPSFTDSLRLIQDAVDEAHRKILKNCENSFRSICNLEPNSTIAKSLENLEASYQRLMVYIRLAFPDNYTRQEAGECIAFFRQGAAYSRSNILTTLTPANLFVMANQLHSLAERIAEELERPLIDLARRHAAETNDICFDAVYRQVIDIRAFYQNRIDEQGSYRDVFEEASATQRKYEEVCEFLNIVGEAVSTSVDAETRGRILARIQTAYTEQGVAPPTRATLFGASHAAAARGAREQVGGIPELRAATP